MQSTPIKSILIVGGGSSGWIMAARLAKHLGSHYPDAVQVTLIESPDIKHIAVGEGTFPTMRNTLRTLGIPEHEFMRECDATFKQSIKFVDWLHAPVNGEHNYFHHLFNTPHAQGDLELTPYWLLGCGYREARYDQNLSQQAAICDAGLGPKKITTPQYESLSHYAYHLDAVKFVALLKKWSTTQFGVRHILGTIDQVHLSGDGSIASVNTKEHGELTADLFIDCSGFASYLLGKNLGIGFIDKSDQLFVDHALAIQVPYDSPEDPIACSTIATAHEAGWTWDIGLSSRRGVGYVYSSRHTSHDRAEQILRNYIGEKHKSINANLIKMRTGYREKVWHKNCVAVGFSAAFFEPLEATALTLVEASAQLLCDKFPYDRESLPLLEKKYNQSMLYRLERICDFVKLHYYISQRNDHQFWIDNRDPASISDELREKLLHWRTHWPHLHDFRDIYETFTASSYEWILYGMNYPTDLSLQASSLAKNLNRVTQEFTRVQQIAAQLVRELPPHRELINKIYQYGLPNV